MFKMLAQVRKKVMKMKREEKHEHKMNETDGTNIFFITVENLLS